MLYLPTWDNIILWIILCKHSKKENKCITPMGVSSNSYRIKPTLILYFHPFRSVSSLNWKSRHPMMTCGRQWNFLTDFVHPPGCVSARIIPSVVPTWHTSPLKVPQSPGSVSQGRWYVSPTCRATMGGIIILPTLAKKMWALLANVN